MSAFAVPAGRQPRLSRRNGGGKAEFRRFPIAGSAEVYYLYIKNNDIDNPVNRFPKMSVIDLLAKDRFAAGAGIELLETRPGYAKARMEITPAHLNGGGVCQGGAIFTLADLAFAAASNSHGGLTLGINATVNFFKSERAGFLYAEAREVYDHRRLSNCEVRVTNENGDLVATYTGTGYRKDPPLR